MLRFLLAVESCTRHFFSKLSSETEHLTWKVDQVQTMTFTGKKKMLFDPDAWQYRIAHILPPLSSNYILYWPSLEVQVFHINLLDTNRHSCSITHVPSNIVYRTRTRAPTECRALSTTPCSIALPFIAAVPPPHAIQNLPLSRSNEKPLYSLSPKSSSRYTSNNRTECRVAHSFRRARGAISSGGAQEECPVYRDCTVPTSSSLFALNIYGRALPHQLPTRVLTHMHAHVSLIFFAGVHGE